MKISRRSNIQPFHAMEILREANAIEASGRDVWHLETGEPITGAPKKVKEAATKIIEKEHIGYTDALGLPELRKRISNHYYDYYGLSISHSRIIITTGSSGGLLLSLLAAFDVSDKVIITEPAYPAYPNMLKALNIVPIYCPTEQKTRFQPTVEILDSLSDKPDGLIIASPANPTGSMLSANEIKLLAEWCEHNDVRIIADEIYHGVTYGNRAQTILNATDDAIIINGFSKYYAMTGWRLGWIVVPKNFVRPIERLAQNLFISPPAISQLAATQAFECSKELDSNLQRYEINRSILQASLECSGFGSVSPAQGAFYLYVDVSPLTNNSHEFCSKMLLEAGVAATPGVDFDRNRGNKFVRFSYAGHTKDIKAAADSIKAWLKNKY